MPLVIGVAGLALSFGLFEARRTNECRRQEQAQADIARFPSSVRFEAGGVKPASFRSRSTEARYSTQRQRSNRAGKSGALDEKREKIFDSLFYFNKYCTESDFALLFYCSGILRGTPNFEEGDN